MNKISKVAWFVTGVLLLVVAYIGVVTPGIPWSTPAVGAAFCFAKSNKRWHDWIMNHRLFGPFLRNWSEKRVFPTRGKWMMVNTMNVSLVILIITTKNLWLAAGVGLLMFLVCVWALRYPGSVEEYEARKARGEPIGWLR